MDDDRMKKILPLLLLFNTSAFAGDYFYGGASLAFNNSIGLEYEDVHIDENNDPGFSVFGGYSFLITPTIELGVELEYQDFGKAEFAKNVSAEGDAYFINARPKFIEANNNLYSAFILGIGSLSGKTKVNGTSSSESEIAYQLGVEVGYMFSQLEFGVGYRYRLAEFDSVDFTNQGFDISMKYRF